MRQFTQPFAALGFGLYLEDAAGDRVDSVGVYPNRAVADDERVLERGEPAELASAAALGESWQRVGGHR